jgi:hypothetical protein
MKDITIPINQIHENAILPERISQNYYKCFSAYDKDIIPETTSRLEAGFYLPNIYFNIIPSNIYNKYNCIPTNNILCNSNLYIEAYCYKKKEKQEYFSLIYKNIPKNTCIFYIKLLSSSNEENYILNIVN